MFFELKIIRIFSSDDKNEKRLQLWRVFEYVFFSILYLIHICATFNFSKNLWWHENGSNSVIELNRSDVTINFHRNFHEFTRNRTNYFALWTHAHTLHYTHIKHQLRFQIWKKCILKLIIDEVTTLQLEIVWIINA